MSRSLGLSSLSILLFAAVALVGTSSLSKAQDEDVGLSGGVTVAHGDIVPREVREITDRGLQYLMKTQDDQGHWPEGQMGPGTTGLGLLAFLASGEDPNFGLYSSPIRKALRSIIRSQNVSTGYMGDSMYHHGFATLALAEAYGAVDETDLWDSKEPAARKRTIAEALELAVRCAVTSQAKNPFGAWRYAPNARDADTSVSGAVLVGLLAARNAGIEVPDECIDKAVKYFTTCTGDSGIVGYSGGMEGFGESTARSSIACLVYSIAKRKDLKQFESVKKYLAGNLNDTPQGYPEYCRYYQAQALFQADVESWQKWNRSIIRQLKATQNPDGSIDGQFGKQLGTSMGLLALALNYKFLPIYER